MLKNVTFATFVLFSFYVHGSTEAEKQSFIDLNTLNTISACHRSAELRKHNVIKINHLVNKAPTPELMAEVEAQKACKKDFLFNLAKVSELLLKLVKLEEKIIEDHNLCASDSNQDELTKHLTRLRANLADMSQNQ